MPANRDRRTGASNSRRHGLTNIGEGDKNVDEMKANLL